MDTPAFEVIDHRGSLTPEDELARERARFPDALIWSEVEKVDGAVDRLHLLPKETLIVWTIPPSSEIWTAALSTVNPSRLILFATRPDTMKTARFLQRLAALAKYALNHKGGAAQLEAMAAAMGQRERSIQVGLQVLSALGKLDYRVGQAGEYQLRASDSPPSDKQDTLQKRLDLLLRETRAYQNYWQTMHIKG